MEWLIYSLIGLVIGIVITLFFTITTGKASIKQAKEEAKRIIDDAKKESDTIKKKAELDAKEHVLNIKRDFEKEMKKEREKIAKQEERLNYRQESIDRKSMLLDSREKELNRKEQQVERELKRIEEMSSERERLLKEVQKQLESVSGLTREEAKRQLIESMKEEVLHEASREMREIVENAKMKAEEEARNIIATAVQRYAGDYATDYTVTLVQLPNNSMKGRIIGRDGRNIKTFESITGVDLIIDDTPEAVIISTFDPFRREVAKLTLEMLISDGRIHPGRIEKLYEKAKNEIQKKIREAGEQAIFDLGISHLHPELVKLVGLLKYRTSYTQNQWQHSIEVGFLCGIMAAELNLDQDKAKRMGLLHDIGKAIDHEVNGSHAVISANLCKKYGEDDVVVRAIHAHHEDIRPEGLYDHLLIAADALSGARPGARKEVLEKYIKRIEEMENICKEFKGVKNAYAIQAGRELRIIVQSEEVSEDETFVLAREIAKKVEENVSYPGQVKVSVVRETRAIEYAR